MKKVLILSDRRAGHFNQSLAVAEAIKSFGPVEEVYVEVKVKKLGKYLLRILLNSRMGQKLFKSRPSLKMIQIFYEGYEWDGQPDIIISAGKDTSLLNAMLALMYGSTNFFIGHPKKLDHSLFSTVLTVLDLGFDNQIVLNVAPTRSYNGDLRVFATTYDLDPQYEYYTLLIGGDGSGYRFEEEDIEQLITFVNATADKVKWLITTSRRTPEAYEAKMEKEMQAECFIAFNKNPQKVVAGFLELSTTVFVTEESASMVSEGVAFRKPVVTLSPEHHDADKNYQKILQKFSTEKRIQRVEISKLENFKTDLEDFRLLELDSCKEIAKKLKYHLLEETS
ncbi:ELM1/GtrOC1 family putative glycosyltransferase [Sulfurovum sp. CS9]|uniref:ELM1/GtrOC1 family putative glycosyltransferase n=1 Tax=Sulfurovum sp. CS9 TaxID=3391146 RepID=UPI0039EC74F1